LMIALIVAFSVVAIPLQVAFDSQGGGLSAFAWVLVACDLVFIIDILFSFATAFRDENQHVVHDPMRIAQHYIRSWFLLDFLSSVPIELAVVASGADQTSDDAGSAVLRMLRFLRLIKVLRMARLFHLPRVAQLVQDVNPSALTLAQYVLALVYAWHFFGCVYWRISHPPGSSDWAPPAFLVNESLAVQYLYAVYWSTGTCTSTASFDRPSTAASMVYTLLVMVTGVMLNGMIIGSLATLVGSLNVNTHQQVRRIGAIRSFLKEKRVPVQTIERVTDYYRFVWRSAAAMGESEILKDLPQILQLQVDIVTTRHIFSRIALLRFLPKRAMLLMVQRIQPVFALPEEIILRQGQPGMGLFLINRGSVRVMIERQPLKRFTAHGLAESSRRSRAPKLSRALTTVFGMTDHSAQHVVLTRDQMFGERSLLSNQPVGASVIASHFTHLLLLDRHDVFILLAEFPDVVKDIFRCAVALDERLLRVPCDRPSNKRHWDSSIWKGRTMHKGPQSQAESMYSSSLMSWPEVYGRVEQMAISSHEMQNHPNDVRVAAKLLVEGELLDELKLRPMMGSMANGKAACKTPSLVHISTLPEPGTLEV